MLDLEISFLTGRYVATAENDRTRAEWPPHPARVFSALVASWAEGVEEPVASDERNVLEWLETLPAPQILGSDAIERSSVTHYVPVNDASVVGLSFTANRADKLEALAADYLEARDDASVKSQRRVASIEAKMAALLDVDKQVSDVGKTSPASALEMLPEGRGRQARQWPSVRPVDPTVVLRWPEVSPSERTVAVLDGICSRVARLGHSSSLVSVRAVAATADTDSARWVPEPDGALDLRWVKRGQLGDLERLHDSHRGVRPRSLPKVGVAYTDRQVPQAPTQPVRIGNLSGEWFSFALRPEDRKRPGHTGLPLIRCLRDALMHHADDPVHPIISGHEPNGDRVRRPHLALAALPFVGARHATGQVLGLAALLPTEVDDDARLAVLRALERWRHSGGELRLGRAGTVAIEGLSDAADLVSTRRSSWAEPARTWISATPIALPRHPGRLSSGTAPARDRAWRNAEQTVIMACVHLDLPEPEEVTLSLAPMMKGVDRARRYPSFHQGPEVRALVHATIRFAEPVTGPLLIGAGRYLGLGLMYPIADRELHQGRGNG